MKHTFTLNHLVLKKSAQQVRRHKVIWHLRRRSALNAAARLSHEVATFFSRWLEPLGLRSAAQSCQHNVRSMLGLFPLSRILCKFDLLLEPTMSRRSERHYQSTSRGTGAFLRLKIGRTALLLRTQSVLCSIIVTSSLFHLWMATRPFESGADERSSAWRNMSVSEEIANFVIAMRSTNSKPVSLASLSEKFESWWVFACRFVIPKQPSALQSASQQGAKERSKENQTDQSNFGRKDWAPASAAPSLFRKKWLCSYHNNCLSNRALPRDKPRQLFCKLSFDTCWRMRSNDCVVNHTLTSCFVNDSIISLMYTA